MVTNGHRIFFKTSNTAAAEQQNLGSNNLTVTVYIYWTYYNDQLLNTDESEL
jgi:hypothetical protein